MESSQEHQFAQQEAPAARPSRLKAGLLVLVGAILGGMIGSAVSVGVYRAIDAPARVAQTSTTASSTGGDRTISALNIDASGEPLTYAEAVAAKVTPSVVSVAIKKTAYNPFTGERSTQAVGNGSGVIIRSDGYILTNSHVVEGADGLTVKIGVEDLEATVVATDPSSDLAVIKVNKVDLPAIEIGSSADLRVGQAVVAIGSPFGLDQSVTTGIVSALGRTSFAESAQSQLTAYTNLIQTDASINPGNSGGALTDAEGRLVGINTLIQTGSQYESQSSGVGFAIPVDYAISIANDLIDTGSAHHPYLGISGMTISPSAASRYKLAVDSGVLVDTVASGSPAESAGIKDGDILVRLGDAEIKSMADVYVAIRSHDVGSKVKIEVVRDGRRLTLEATLGSES